MIVSDLTGQCLNQQRVTRDAVKQTQQFIPRAADPDRAPQTQRIIVAQPFNEVCKAAGQRHASNSLQIRWIKSSADEYSRCSNPRQLAQEIARSRIGGLSQTMLPS